MEAPTDICLSSKDGQVCVPESASPVQIVCGLLFGAAMLAVAAYLAKQA